jgi:hypothetical protein
MFTEGFFVLFFQLLFVLILGTLFPTQLFYPIQTMAENVVGTQEENPILGRVVNTTIEEDTLLIFGEFGMISADIGIEAFQVQLSRIG